MYEPEANNRHQEVAPTPSRTMLVLATSASLIVVALAASALALSLRQRSELREVHKSHEQVATAIERLRAQLDAVSNQLAAAQAAPAPVRQILARPTPAPTRQLSSSPRREPARSDDPRWRSVEARLSEHQKEIAGTRDAVAKTRQELEHSLAATRDELSGRIAKTHEEVEALRKLGERNYYEFTVPKSKQFQRVGPLSLALRKTNVKRQTYDVELIVDDYKLKKKDINLYEPVLIHLADRPQPLELVVNRIGKNEARGYISEPKFKTSELATRTTLTPAAAPPSPSR
jgi:hypothetical protein